MESKECEHYERKKINNIYGEENTQIKKGPYINEEKKKTNKKINSRRTRKVWMIENNQQRGKK